MGQLVMPHRVNLDALIRRENFEAIVESSNTDTADEAPKLKIVELEESSLLYRLLRKPDFQRTTAHWLPDTKSHSNNYKCNL